jgi:hypothetical protein
MAPVDANPVPQFEAGPQVTPGEGFAQRFFGAQADESGCDQREEKYSPPRASDPDPGTVPPYASSATK